MGPLLQQFLPRLRVLRLAQPVHLLLHPFHVLLRLRHLPVELGGVRGGRLRLAARGGRCVGGQEQRRRHRQRRDDSHRQ